MASARRRERPSLHSVPVAVVASHVAPLLSLADCAALICTDHTMHSSLARLELFWRHALDSHLTRLGDEQGRAPVRGEHEDDNDEVEQAAAPRPSLTSWLRDAQFVKGLSRAPTVSRNAEAQHEDEVLHACFSASGQYVLSAGRDGKLLLHEVDYEHATMTVAARADFAPDVGVFCCFAPGDGYVAVAVQRAEEWRLDGYILTYSVPGLQPVAQVEVQPSDYFDGFIMPLPSAMPQPLRLITAVRAPTNVHLLHLLQDGLEADPRPDAPAGHRTLSLQDAPMITAVPTDIRFNQHSYVMQLPFRMQFGDFDKCEGPVPGKQEEYMFIAHTGYVRSMNTLIRFRRMWLPVPDGGGGEDQDDESPQAALPKPPQHDLYIDAEGCICGSFVSDCRRYLFLNVRPFTPESLEDYHIYHDEEIAEHIANYFSDDNPDGVSFIASLELDMAPTFDVQTEYELQVYDLQQAPPFAPIRRMRFGDGKAQTPGDNVYLQYIAAAGADSYPLVAAPSETGSLILIDYEHGVVLGEHSVADMCVNAALVSPVDPRFVATAHDDNRVCLFRFG